MIKILLKRRNIPNNQSTVSKHGVKFIFMTPRSKVCHSVILSETFTLLIIFESECFDISHKYSLWQDLSVGTNNCDLGLEFDLLENFNLAYNFWTVSVRALIFHTSIFCDKTLPWVPTFWLIDWIVFYAVSAIFQPCNGGTNILTIDLGVLPPCWKL